MLCVPLTCPSDRIRCVWQVLVLRKIILLGALGNKKGDSAHQSFISGGACCVKANTGGKYLEIVGRCCFRGTAQLAAEYNSILQLGMQLLWEDA